MGLPRRAARWRAQVRSASASGGRRRRIETAAWMSSQRVRLEPALVMAPRRCVTGAALAWHEAEVGLKLVRVVKALDVIDRGDERGGRDGPDAGHGAEALHALIVSGHALDRLVGV